MEVAGTTERNPEHGSRNTHSFYMISAFRQGETTRTGLVHGRPMSAMSLTGNCVHILTPYSLHYSHHVHIWMVQKGHVSENIQTAFPDCEPIALKEGQGSGGGAKPPRVA
jgi:hypothetical protein